MLDARGIGSVAGALARMARCDGLLDLAEAAALGPLDPGGLGVALGDAGELADGGPAEVAGGEGLV